MIITKHGKKRVKERLGLPKRAHNRHLETVVRQGKLYSRKGWREFKVIYHGFIYIFALSRNLKPILVTTYKINNNTQILQGKYNERI